jgi:hypothetical protein
MATTRFQITYESLLATFPTVLEYIGPFPTAHMNGYQMALGTELNHPMLTPI